MNCRRTAPLRAWLTAFSFAVLATSTQAAEIWRTYTNARFGYSICYPQELLAKPEAPNADGRVFDSLTGGKLTVFGTYQLLGANLAEEAGLEEKRLTGSNGQITYKVVHPNWFVISGLSSGRIFYLKTVSNGDAFATFELSYPHALSKHWSLVSARLNKCFALSNAN